MAETFDFIVVGSGPGGATLASRLAHTPAAPRVLLLEAGSANPEVDLRLLAERFQTFATRPDMDWGYSTTPQPQLNNRKINQARGRTLGGSSALNFCVWTLGARDDFDEWARLVGDEAFGFEEIQRRFKRLEGLDVDVPERYRKYVRPLQENHGTKEGPVKVEIAKTWEKSLAETVDAIQEAGWKVNRDLNDGSMMGIGVAPSTALQGLRTTAAVAFLQDPPENLTIKTNAPVSKVLFDGQKAVGVQVGSERYFSRNEVILSAGAFNTPQILMLSGVGPKDQLDQHGIPAVHHLEGVGKNLQDHPVVPISYEMRKEYDDRVQLFTNVEQVAKAKEQFLKDGTGPLSVFYQLLGLGYAKLPEVMETPEFKALPEEIQKFLTSPTIPQWEIITHTVPLVGPGATPDRVWTNPLAVLQGVQSRGSIKLASADPADTPLIDAAVLTHPFDKKAMIEAVKEVMKIFKTPSFANNMVPEDEAIAGINRFAPASDSDEDVWNYIKETAFTTWHMSCTARMGKSPEDGDSVVDNNFKVFGLQGLRVADMSVTPFLPTGHVQTCAYLIGETAAEKIIREYKMDKSG